jgi:hypothetical protein
MENATHLEEAVEADEDRGDRGKQLVRGLVWCMQEDSTLSEKEKAEWQRVNSLDSSCRSSTKGFGKATFRRGYQDVL